MSGAPTPDPPTPPERDMTSFEDWDHAFNKANRKYVGWLLALVIAAVVTSAIGVIVVWYVQRPEPGF